MDAPDKGRVDADHNVVIRPGKLNIFSMTDGEVPGEYIRDTCSCARAGIFDGEDNSRAAHRGQTNGG